MKIFISYRREGSEKAAQSIYKQVAMRVGPERVFLDTRSIPFGAHFERSIEQEIEHTAAQLIIVGPNWAGDNGEHLRVNDDQDMVRFELVAANTRHIPQYPIFLPGAKPPDSARLRPPLDDILKGNGIALKGDDPAMDAGFTNLIKHVVEHLPQNDQAPGWRDFMTPKLDEAGFIYNRSNGVDFIQPPVRPVTGGSFTMGSTDDEDEQPPHTVTLATFWIGAYPVTVAEYRCFVHSGHPCPPDHDMYWQDQLGRLDHPVVNVSWQDAVAYCRWLSERAGQTWRLPSEAEWEKAARWNPEDGSTTVYPWGNSFEANRCNSAETKRRGTTPVWMFSRGVSPSRVFDTAGNVWEWTSSILKPYPHEPGSRRDALREQVERVRRGGSWASPAVNVRSAKRAGNEASHLDNTVGFRVALAAN